MLKKFRNHKFLSYNNSNNQWHSNNTEHIFKVVNKLPFFLFSTPDYIILHPIFWKSLWMVGYAIYLKLGLHWIQVLFQSGSMLSRQISMKLSNRLRWWFLLTKNCSAFFQELFGKHIIYLVNSTCSLGIILDFKLTGCPHFEYIAIKGKKILQIISAMRGTWWGASKWGNTLNLEET